jgi:hypothetical protein
MSLRSRPTTGAPCRALCSLPAALLLRNLQAGSTAWQAACPARSSEPAGQQVEGGSIALGEIALPRCRFGFNNGQTSVDGLWAGGSAYNTDFAAIAYQLQLLGFNAIRVPFIFG